MIWWAEPDLNRRPSPRKGDILTTLDDRPSAFLFPLFPNKDCILFPLEMVKVLR
jgi:hypothetical protein